MSTRSFTARLRERRLRHGTAGVAALVLARPFRRVVKLRVFFELGASSAGARPPPAALSVATERAPRVAADPRVNERPLALPDTEELVEVRDARGDKVAGLRMWLDRDVPLAYVFDVAVEPASRGQGVARALLDEAKRAAAEQGYDELRVAVGATNRAGQRAYRKAGFRLRAVGVQVWLRRKHIPLLWWRISS